MRTGPLKRDFALIRPRQSSSSMSHFSIHTSQFATSTKHQIPNTKLQRNCEPCGPPRYSRCGDRSSVSATRPSRFTRAAAGISPALEILGSCLELPWGLEFGFWCLRQHFGSLHSPFSPVWPGWKRCSTFSSLVIC